MTFSWREETYDFASKNKPEFCLCLNPRLGLIVIYLLFVSRYLWPPWHYYYLSKEILLIIHMLHGFNYYIMYILYDVKVNLLQLLMLSIFCLSFCVCCYYSIIDSYFIILLTNTEMNCHGYVYQCRICTTCLLDESFCFFNVYYSVQRWHSLAL